ncbi:Ig-like domain repeat protein [Acidovorax sp. NCPPB 4044]|uniref:Ig-like domain repeat protein n=1 Tax=Acidovorax sp. NCPPB 4044 TaxID=2940490 RepID=UPI002304227A|nr:Ig-like domain repeat protein [Acidovorax sp. NCPPB 4044]MDA8521012.1 Ig-like domain repeat protein [Acidovorax sp. NCPPB 4044]
MVAIVSGNNLGLSTSSFATLGQGGVFGSATQGRGGEQAYVNLATGNMVLQRRDDFVASQGQGMDVLRTYNSRGLLDDDNADNWSIGIYNQPLRLTGTRNAAGSVLSRTARDGARSDYSFDTAQGLYVGTDGAGAHDTLRWDEAAGQYVWTDGDSGEQERYEGSGDQRLVSRSDAHGNTTRYQYGADGLLASVTGASGETTHYDYTGRNLAQIRVVAQDGSTSTRVRYAYDASNRLASVTVDLSPGDNSTADGKVYQTTYTYDGDSRRVASVTQTDGTRLEIGYALIDGDYRVASVKDALGLTTRYTYDTTARTTTVTDPLNVAIRYAYDDRGQLLRVQTGITEARPAGLSQLYYRYDSQGNVTAMTDALGRSIALQYDAQGNQTVKVDPLGNTLVRTYDERNQLLTETLRAGDGNGSAASAPTFGGSTSSESTTRYVYSAQERGQLRFVLSAEGRVTEYRYNALGQRVTALAYAAAAYDLSGLGSSGVPTETQMAAWAAVQDLRGGQRTDTRYDFRGQVAYSIAYGALDAGGEGSDPAATQYIYSQAGELLKTVQPRTDSITEYVYDGLGRVIVASAPSSDGTTANTTVTEYGAASTTVTLVNGLSTVSNYDAAGRLTSVLQSSAGTTLGITRYAYDAAGRLVMTQDPTGVRQWLLYDDAGRKVADVDGTGAATEYRYNVNGQLAQTIAYARTLGPDLNAAPTLEAVRALATADDRKSWRLYDSAQRLAWQVDSAGAVTQTEYDAASRVVAVTRLATPIDTQLLGDGSALTVGPAGLTSVANGQKAATGIAVRVSAAAVASGATLTLEASVAGSQPAGRVTFYSGSTAIGSAQIVDGVARLALNTLAVGTYAINARYEGDATHAAATSTAVAATVLQATAVSLDALPGTVALGRSQVLRATVAGGAPGGTVTFFDGSAVIGSGVLQNVAGVPTATVVWNVQTPGNHAIAAVYSGDAATASAATSSAVTVRAGLASEIALESGATPSTVNMALTLRARVSVPGSQTQPTGSIAFYRGTELLATAALDAQGVAVVSTSALAAGLHSLTAVYLGDDAVAGSRSASFTQTVLPAASTTAVLATSHVQIAAGASLALTVRVAAVADPATALGGTVTFYDGDTRLGSAALVNGQASFNAAGVTAGSHGYRAVYGGDAADAASTSATATVISVANGPSIATPVARSTGLVLAVSSTAIAKGNAVAVTATVTGNHPTGSVTFVSGGRILGSAVLVDGQAVLSFTPSEAGELSVQALYAGDAGNPATASGEPARIVVAPSPARMVLSVSSTQAVRGTGVVLTATLSGSDTAAAPTGSVTFYANGAAIGTAVLSQGLASLAIATLDIGSNAITVQYAGDARNAAVSSAAQDLRIISAPASVALGASSQQAAAGAAVTFTATVVPATSGTSPTGRVDFFNGTSFLGSASLANGTATLTTNGLRNVGVANVTAVYTGEASGAVSKPFSVSISSGVELSVSSTRIVSGNPVVLSANVGSGTGTVSFFDGSVYLGSASASNGMASLTTKALTQAGSHAITAVYAGDANRAGAASAATTLQVADAVELAASGSTVIAGAPLVLTASVNSATSAIVNGVAVPAGAIANGVTLIDGTVTKTSGASDWESSIRSTVGVSGGASVSFKAGQTNKAIMVGLNTDPGTNDNYLTIDWAIYITYDGAMYAYQNGASVASLGTYTTGDVLSVEYLNGVVSYRKNGTVLRQESANITQPLYLDTSFYGTGGAITGLKFRNASGQEVPLSAAAAPTGTVTFFNGREVLGTANVVNGVARLTTSALAAQGTAQITAVYGGDANNAAATSAARTVAVNDAIGLGASATSVAAGDAVTLTARMNAQPSVVATGVSFDGGAVRKTGTASQWDASVRSVVGYAGGASVRFTVGAQSDQNYVIGLNTDPASDNGVASLDWAIHVSGSTVELYRDGVLVANVGTIVAGDVLALGYDAGAVSYAKNGVVLRRETVQISQPLYLDSSFYTPGSAVSGLEFRDGAGTLVALSAKPAATGRVTFHSGGAVLGTATLVDGVASLTTRGLTAAGMASITALFESDSDGTKVQSQPLIVGVTGTGSQTAAASNAPVLSVSSTRIVSGNPVVLSANVGSGTGTVSFFDGSVYLGSASASNGMASLTTKALTQAGSHAITAVYAGDANRAGAASAATTLQVADAVELAASGSTVIAGAPLVLTASVNSATSAIVNGVAVPAGAIANGVTLIDGTVTKTSGASDWESSIRSTVGVSGGASVSFKAGQTNKAIMVGLNTDPGTNDNYLTIDWAIYITYDGAMYAYQNGASVASLGTYTTGDVLSVEYLNGVVSYRKNGTVLRQESANITQPLYLDTSFYGTGGAITGLKFRNASGQEVPLSAAAAPTGTVTFFNGREVLGTANVVNGVARLTTSALAAQGTAQITAVYGGDANNAAATSAARTVAVNDAIGLGASATSVAAGDAVTLTARMNAQPSVVATGVSFDGGAVRKTGTASQWDASVRSVVGYAGGASVRFTVGAQSDQNYVIGLNTDPASDNGVASLDWAIHVSGSTVELYRDGVLVANVGTIVAGDVLALGYDAGAVSYAKNGVVLRRETVQISQPLYLDSSFYTPGSAVSGLEFRDGAGTLVALSAKPAATGRVTFHSGGAVLGTATLVDGVASLTTRGLTAAGMASITAAYEGDANNAAGFSSPMVLPVGAAPGGLPPTTTSLAVSSASTSRGQEVALTATVTGGASGFVTFFSGNQALGVAALVNGVATWTTKDLPVGAHAWRAVYTGDAQSASSTSSVVSGAVTAAGSGLTLAATVASRSASEVTVTLAARVAGLRPGGTVTFYNNDAPIGGGTVGVVGGVATLSVTLPAGAVRITARYSGDADNAAAASEPLALSLRGGSTVVVAAPSPASTVYGSPVTLSATAPYSSANAGTVSFYAGDLLVGVASVQPNGVATLVSTAIPVGTRTVLAAYSGNAEREPASQSAAAPLVVTGMATQTVLTASRSQRIPGSPLVLDATTTSAGRAAGISGTVRFYAGSTLLGTVQATDGVARLTLTDVPANAGTFTAVYSGFQGFDTSTSQTESSAALAAGTSVSLETSAPSVGNNAAVTLSARVTGRQPGGNVTFLRAGAVLGTAAVVNGVASLVVTGMPLGTHDLSARYDGDALNSASSSAVLAQTVTAGAGISLSLASSDTLEQGSAVSFAVGGMADGVVTLLDGTTAVSTARVVNGIATLSTRDLAIGSHQLTVSYGANASSPVALLGVRLTLTPGQAPTAVALGAATNRTEQGLSTLLSAQVSGSQPGGRVTFYNGDTALGTVDLIYGLAVLTTDAPPSALDRFRAVYLGDTGHAGSASAVLAGHALEGEALSPLTRSTLDRTLAQIHSQDGLLLGTVDGEGYLTEYRYDAAARMIGSVRYAQPVAGGATAAAAVRSGSLSSLRPTARADDAHTAYFHDVQGRRVGELDAEGHLTETRYDANGNVAAVRRYANAVTAITAAQVTAATRLADLLPAASAQDQVTTRSYDALNRLSASVNAEGTMTQYRYDSMGRLAQTVQAVGAAEARTATTRYDALGRVTGELTAQGAALLSASGGGAQTEAIWQQYGLRHTYDAAGRRTSTTDPNGQQTLFFYDAAGRLTHTVNAMGEITETRYNAFGEVASNTRTANRIDRWALANAGGLSGGLANASVLAALGQAHSAAADATVSYRYNATGTLAQSTDALGFVRNYVYNTFGEETRLTAAAGTGAAQTVATAYDRRGLAVQRVQDPDALRVASTTAYDAFGRAISTTDALGQVRTQAYDRMGRLIVAADALGGRSTTAYDAFGRTVTQTDALGHTTTYTYSQEDRSVTVTTPEGIRVSTAHDRLGQTVSVQDGSGAVTRYEYDANGRQTAVQTALTRTEGRYDAGGRLVETTDANGIKTALAYDAAGRVLTRTADPSGLNLVTRYSYDALGNQLSVTDAQGVVTQFGYDTKGQLVRQVVDPAGLALATSYAYDGLGHQVSVTAPDGTTTAYQYDTLGRRVLEVVDPSTATHAGLNLARRYAYDAAGNVTNVTDAQGHATRYAYDKEGRQRFVLDAAGNLAETAYDAAGRVVRQTRYAQALAGVDGLPLAVGEGQLDGLKIVQPAKDQTEHRIYDADSRVTATVNGAGDVVRFDYDGAGRVVQRTAHARRLDMAKWVVGTDPKPDTDPTNSPDGVTRTVYDALGRVRYSIDGTGAVVSQRYDGNGNVTQRIRYAKRLDLTGQPLSARPNEAELAQRVEGTGSAPALYDAQRDEQTRMRYDAAGRLALMADGAGGVTQYLYDKNGRLLQSTRYATPIGDTGTQNGPITVPQASLSDAFVRKVYDAAGRLTVEVDASGAVSTYGYDAAGRLLRETRLAVPADAYRRAQAGGALLAEPTPVASSGDRTVRHFLDRAGRETLTIDAEGGATERFYDGTGQLLQVRQSATALTGSQIADLESQRAQAGELGRSAIAQKLPANAADRTTRNYYDAAGRLRFTRDALGQLQGYVYDGVGRLTGRTTYMGTQGADAWIEEGVTGYMKTAGGEGRKPLYRLSRTSGPGDHFYTSDPAERDWALQNGWQAEGDVGYLQSAPAAGTAPLYRLRPPGTSTNHFYTASEDLRAYAKNVLGWTDEGIMGYIDVAPGKDNGALYQLNANGTNEHFHSRGRAEIDLALMPNPTATAGLDRTESLRYDAAGNLVASTDAAGKHETTEYDGTGRKERFTNKAGSTWNYAYNAAGQLTQETSPQVKLFDGQNEVLASVVTRMDYDALGHLTARTEAAGLPEARTTRYEYDALGRQVKTIFPPVAVYQGESAAALLDNGRNAAGTRTDTTIAEISSETRYDTLGNAVAGRAAGSTAWSYKAYDRANHVAWDIDALGYVTGYTRNAFGEAERLVRYARNIATRSDGTLLREDEVRQAVAARASSADRDILTGYDRLGRAQEVQEPYVFSVDGSTAEQGAGRKTTRNSYDALGNLVAVATNVGNARWATTRYGYDVLGRRVGTTDAMGYATSDTYDAAGNVVRHVEYARAGTAPGSTPETAAGDRVTDTTYDLLNRKTTETRRGVAYTATDAGAAGIGGVLQDRTGDLATQYAYDALGNLVRTTDALGGTTYQYYDVLGRVRASITPTINVGVAANGQGRAPVAPLTEYRRDAHGNAVATTQYASGAAVSADGSDYTRSASGSDRTSYARFDAQGHTLETIDAQGNSHYYAYDAQGRLAKEWQKVTYVDDAGARQVHSLWRAYAYDTLGRQTHTYAPLQKSTDPGQLSLGDTELTYNAFGEVTRKRVLDGGQALQGEEVYDYDNAGRVWRSNAGDGVMKVMAYDLQGRQTVQLVASGALKLEDFGDALAALGAQANAPEQFRRTDMRYDLLGRLVQTLAPERASERAMAITTRQNLVYAVMTQSEVNDSRVDKSSNQVDLVWRSLQDLGSGDVRITLQYLSAKYNNENQDNPDGNPAKSVTRNIVVSAEEAATGYSFKWQSPLSGEPGIAKGISAIQGIKVEKLDIFGNWATLYDVAQPTATTGQLPWNEAASPGYIWNEAGEGRKPIYRYYNGSNDTHLFSANSADRDALLNQRTGWLDEGIAGYVASAPADGLTALYRLGKAGTDISVYTSSTQKRSELLASGWEDRGIDGYVGSPGADAAAMAQKGMTLLHALQHHRSASGDAEWKDGLYTTSLSERNALLQGLPPSQQQQQAQSQGSSGASWGGSVSPTGNASSGSATTGGIGRTTVLYGAITAQSLEVSLPQDVVSSLRMETRPAGGTQWEARTLGSAALRTFGSAHRIDVSQLGLAPGGYEYRITNVQGGEVREVGSGTFALGANGAPDADNAPRLQGVGPARANIDGTSYQVLQWPQPAQDQSVVFRWRPQGSTAWTGSRTAGNGLYAYGDGRTSGFGVGMQGAALDMAAGSYEYEIVVTNAAGGTAQRARGVMVIPQNAALANTTPAIVMTNNNVTNLGLVGYLWTEPAPDRKPLVRYYFPYQGNSHHLSTADAGVIANLDDRIARDAAAGSPPAIVREGILGYVQISPTGSNQRLYQYKYGDDVVYRLTANPADVGNYQPIYADPKNDSNFHFVPNTWYQNAYQNDGFISSVPVEGTTALYAVYNGNAQGTLSLGDYFTSPSEYEVISSFMLRAATAATQTLAGVGMGRAVIDGSDHAVLQWPQQEAGARVKITASPGIPGGTPAPYLFRQGDGRSQFAGGAALQGFVLDGLNPGATYQVRIEVEHPAAGGRSAYLARTDVTITVPSTGMNAAVAVTDTTPAYLPPLRAQTAAAAAQGDMSGRPVTAREFDRWGNVTAIDETQGLGEGKLVRTAELRYDANNQVVEQRRLHEDANFAQSWASTRIYYDALGRQVGLRDANGNLNAQVRDLAGNVVQERHADGGRLDNAFNAFGDKVSSAELVDAATGRTTVTGYDYDRMSRLTKTTLVQGEAWRSGVESIGGKPEGQTSDIHASNQVAMSGQVAMSVLERAEYDEAGRKVRTVNGNQEATRYRYDRAGNVVLSGQETAKDTGADAGASVPAASLAYQMRYRYDALGRKVGQSDAAGMNQAWTYDTFGRLIGRTESKTGGGTVDSTYAYDRAGGLVHEGNGAGKNIDYRYDGAGQLIEIRDNALGQTTSYSYDLAGNRVAEKLAQKTLLSSGVLDNVVYQDNHLVYDAQHRLRAVFDGRADVRIAYDLAGNRSQVTSHVINTIRQDPNAQPLSTGRQEQQVIHTSTTRYGYDQMNRQSSSEETGSAGQRETHTYQFDLAGNRVRDDIFVRGTKGDGSDNLGGHYEYRYDALNRLQSYSGFDGPTERQTNVYDGAGRVVYSMSLVKSNGLWNEEHRYNRYDATGRVQDTRVVLRRDDTKAVTQRTDVAYHDAGGATGLGYDAAGNLLGNRQVTDGDEGKATVTKYEYQFMAGSYQQTSSSAKREGNEATTKTWRDANGFVSNIEQVTGVGDERFNRAFVNDAQGNAIYVNQGAGHTGRIQNPGTYLGGWVGDSLNPGHVQRQLVAHGEVLARYGDAPDSENPPANAGDVPKYVSTAEFRLNAAPLQLKGANLDAIAYTVVGGETLKDIARNVLGDAKLWWRIAEANGLAVSGDGQLKAGQTLSVPKLALNANSVDTFQPYEPGRVTGSMDPLLPAPAGQDGGCGAVGKIIMVVVAVAVSVFTGGVGGAMLGNLLGQVVGNALGVQDGINWKSVALSGISAGIASGLEGVSGFSGTDWSQVALRMGTANLATQGIGVATGLQSRFDWRSVAASAAGAAAGSAAGTALKDASWLAGLSDTAREITQGTLRGLAAGVTTAVARGGRISIQQVATDAFGNALGESIAARAQSGSYMGEGTNLSPYVSDGEHLAFNNATPLVNFSRANALMASAPDFGNNIPPDEYRSSSVLYADASTALKSSVVSDAGGGSSIPSLPGGQAHSYQGWESFGPEETVGELGAITVSAKREPEADPQDFQAVNDQRAAKGSYDRFREIGDSWSAGNYGAVWRHITFEASAPAQNAINARLFPQPSPQIARIDKMLASPIGTIISGAGRLFGASQQTQDALLATGSFAEQMAGAGTNVYKQTLTAKGPSPFFSSATTKSRGMDSTPPMPGSLRFEPAGYHGTVDNAVKSRGPVNGQNALDFSVQVKDTSPRRIGIDYQTGDFVVFDRTLNDIYHGHVRQWSDLHPDMQKVLRKMNMVDSRGNILKD